MKVELDNLERSIILEALKSKENMAKTAQKYMDNQEVADKMNNELEIVDSIQDKLRNGD